MKNRITLVSWDPFRSSIFETGNDVSEPEHVTAATDSSHGRFELCSSRVFLFLPYFVFETGYDVSEPEYDI